MPSIMRQNEIVVNSFIKFNRTAKKKPREESRFSRAPLRLINGGSGSVQNTFPVEHGEMQFPMAPVNTLPSRFGDVNMAGKGMMLWNFCKLTAFKQRCIVMTCLHS